MQYRILIEKSCEECDETGKVEVHTCQSTEECPGAQANVECGEIATVNCSECDGSGFVQELIDLKALKILFKKVL